MKLSGNRTRVFGLAVRRRCFRTFRRASAVRVYLIWITTLCYYCITAKTEMHRYGRADMNHHYPNSAKRTIRGDVV